MGMVRGVPCCSRGALGKCCPPVALQTLGQLSLSAQSCQPCLGRSPALPGRVCDGLGRAGSEGTSRERSGRRCGAGAPAHRPHTAGATGSLSLPTGDGLRCLRPGGCPEPRGCGDRDAAARDQPRGGGFCLGPAAAEPEPATGTARFTPGSILVAAARTPTSALPTFCGDPGKPFCCLACLWSPSWSPSAGGHARF